MKSQSSGARQRFEASMRMDQDKWRDGEGYDLSIYRTATPDEKREIEALLVARGIRDWRDAEALAEINSPRSRRLLEQALAGGDPAIQAAVLDKAPQVGSLQQRIGALVGALENGDVYGGLTQALLVVEEFHSKEIIDALFRGVLARDGATAGEFAAMLMYLHGKANEPFDWDHRPFFLRFQEEDRRALFRELCERLGVDPAQYL